MQVQANNSAAMQAQRQQLRQQMKAARTALSAAQQQQAANDLVEQALAQNEVQQARRIGLYHAFGAELNTMPLLTALLANGKHISMPVLHPCSAGHLLMLNYHPDSELQLNQFGIPEPVLRVADVTPLSAIDCLLIPLLGFDANGNRLGMGGGFYDRTLASWARGRYPHLSVFGLAHDCQQLSAVPVASWDVPIPAVITPSRCLRFKKSP
jgi:5-formyltetrahydrofolate cyclo-ligase